MVFNDAAFGPNLIILMTSAFDAANEKLSAQDEISEAAKKLMALGVMLAVQAGERDHENLTRIAIAAVSNEPRPLQTRGCER